MENRSQTVVYGGAKGFLGFALAENPNLTTFYGKNSCFVNCINFMGLVHSGFDCKLCSDSLGGKFPLTTSDFYCITHYS